MGPEVVVVMPPGFQFLARIEALDEPVLIGLARRDVVPLDVAFLTPAQDRHAGQLGAVIAGDRLGPCHPFEHRSIELTPDPSAGDLRAGGQAHALAAIVVDHGEDTHPPSPSALPAPSKQR